MARASGWLIATVCLAAGVGVGAVAFLRGAPPRGQPPGGIDLAEQAEQASAANERLAQELARLRQHVAEIKRRLAELEGRGVAPPAVAGAAGRSSAPEASGPALTAKERDQIMLDAALTNLAAALTKAPLDPPRQERVRGIFQGILARPELAGSRLSDVSCSSALCKFVIDHDSPEVRQRFMDQDALGDPALNGDTFSHYFKDSRQTLIYMGLPGQPLPVRLR